MERGREVCTRQWGAREEQAGVAVLGSEQSSFAGQSLTLRVYPSYYAASLTLLILYPPLCFALRRETA